LRTISTLNITFDLNTSNVLTLVSNRAFFTFFQHKTFGFLDFLCWYLYIESWNYIVLYLIDYSTLTKHCNISLL